MSGRLPTTPPTLADVAERAGVSRQTVSNAVNNPDLLRADTLARVQEAIAELGYLPNRAARNLRTRASHLIGLRIQPVLEGTANPTMDRFVHSLVEASREAGYHVLLFSGEPGEPLAGYDDLLRSTAVDAFVVTDTYLGNPQASWLDSRRAPFVAFGRPWENPTATHAWVDVDGAAGCQLATDHLLDKGHERVAWIGWRKDSRIGEDRRAGWHRAMHARGLPTTGLASRVEDTVVSGRSAAGVLLDEARPTAFVCASDTLAMGVLHTLHERGLRAGDDVAVVGFDDSQVAQVVRPGLSSVRQPLEEVAVEDVLGSAVVSDPLHLLDICATSDGAAAVILVSEEYAQRIGLDDAVRVAAVSTVTPTFPNTVLDMPMLSTDAGTPGDRTFKQSIGAAAYDEAGVGPEDVDVAEVYDLSTALELDWMEDLGLCKEGEAESLLRAGDTTIGGRIPVNPSGGLACFGEAVPAQALAQVCELTWQLRGQAGERQVEGARVGITANQGLFGHGSSVLLTR